MSDALPVAVVAVQARLAVHHLESPDSFRRFIEDVSADAVTASHEVVGTDSADAAHRVFVFPEAIGHFLPLAFAPTSILSSATLADAFAALAVRRPWSVVRGMIEARGIDLRKGVLHAVLPEADRLMRATFAGVARKHRATVVAGSHVRVRDAGHITNSSYTFDPTGRLVAITDKVNLVPAMEDSAPGGLGLTRGDPHRVPVVETGWGRLATLICYDGFREAHTRNERFAFMGPRADAAKVDLIANPAANPWPWEERWFYAEPGEQVLRFEQWRTEGLPATLASLRHTRFGVTAHLCGEIFDQFFEGRSEILMREDGEVHVLAEANTRDRTEVVAACLPIAANAANAGHGGGAEMSI